LRYTVEIPLNEIPITVAKEVGKSIQRIFTTEGYDPKKGLPGSIVDAGTGMIAKTLQESIRLPSWAISNIIVWTSKKVIGVVGDTVKVTGKAVLLNLPVVPVLMGYPERRDAASNTPVSSPSSPGVVEGTAPGNADTQPRPA